MKSAFKAFLSVWVLVLLTSTPIHAGLWDYFSSPGEVFVGTWQNTNGAPNGRLEIARDGNAFVIRGVGGLVLGATLRGEQLVTRVDIGELVFTYSKQSDSLLMGGSEFKRMK